MNPLELENRLVRFSVMCIKLVREVKQVEEGKHLCTHLIRSGTSAALNYAEARDGESLRDFIHKMKIVLKELREVFVCTKILSEANLCHSNTALECTKNEANQLISIFVQSVKTAQKNNSRT